MKGLILAAGKGQRIFKKIKKNKCLIRVSKITLIQKIINNFKSNYIKDIIVLTGFKKEKIKNHLKKEKIKFLNNPNFASTEMLQTMIMGLRKINEDLIISYSDIIYDDRIISKLLNFNNKDKDILLPVLTNWKKIWKIKKKGFINDAETLLMDSDNKISEIGNKIKDIKKVKSQYMGIILIPKEKIKKILKLYYSLKFKKIHLSTFLNILIKNKIIIRGLKTRHHWYEFDDMEDMKNYSAFYKKNVF